MFALHILAAALFLFTLCVFVALTAMVIRDTTEMAWLRAITATFRAVMGVFLLWIIAGTWLAIWRAVEAPTGWGSAAVSLDKEDLVNLICVPVLTLWLGFTAWCYERNRQVWAEWLRKNPQWRKGRVRS